jgi:hypothetical protein
LDEVCLMQGNFSTEFSIRRIKRGHFDEVVIQL